MEKMAEKVDYKIVDNWNLKDRDKLDRDGLDLLLEKILSDIRRAIRINIEIHHKKVKKNTLIPGELVPALLKNLEEDLERMISWRFTGKDIKEGGE